MTTGGFLMGKSVKMTLLGVNINFISIFFETLSIEQGLSRLWWIGWIIDSYYHHIVETFIVKLNTLEMHKMMIVTILSVMP